MTAAIIVACIGIHGYRVSNPAISQSELNAVLEERLDVEDDILRGYGFDDIDDSGVRSDMQRGMLIALRRDRAGSPEARELAQADAEVRAVLDRDLGYRIAYRPSDGISPAVVTYAFAHEGWVVLLVNLLFLCLVGSALEERWGHLGFALFYALGGAVAALAHMFWNRHSPEMLLGASGVVSAAMGAFLILCYSSRIRIGYFVGVAWGSFKVAAWTAVPVWFLIQLAQSGPVSHGPLAVYSVHLGGLAVGLGVAGVLRLLAPEQAGQAQRESRAELASKQVVDDYLTARTLVREGCYAEAIPLLQALLAHMPDDLDVLRKLFQSAVGAGDHASLRASVSPLLERLGRRGDNEEVLQVASTVRQMSEKTSLSEAALIAVGRAAGLVEDGELAVWATREMMSQHRGSARIPELMWMVALLQERRERPDLARNTLTQLLERYPDHAVAAKARDKLATTAAEAGD